MTVPYYISASRAARPSSRRTIFCDGGWGSEFRPAHDLHLSHWIPNRTPIALKADTSTEICLNFLARGGNVPDYDLIVNDHVDVDGMLSVFVLRFPEPAQANRRLLIEAAEMGDFWGWGEERAQGLFQALTLRKDNLLGAGTDPYEIYQAGFECILEVCADRQPIDVRAGLHALRESVRLIDEGVVTRHQVSDNLTLFLVPRAVAAGQLDRCLHVPKFNAALSRASLLLPQARARWDSERMQLLAVETEDGWFYDLWLPGYAWADTPQRRPAPGLTSTGDSNVHVFNFPPLDVAASALQQGERAEGTWSVTRQLSPFKGLKGRGFPIVLSFMRADGPAPSRHSPLVVSDVLATALAR